MPTIINQGRPRPSYFWLAKPPGVKVDIGDTIVCRNPKTTEQIQAKCIDKSTQQWSDLPDSFGYTTYGWPIKQLREALIAQNPEFENDEVKFLLLKQL